MTLGEALASARSRNLDLLRLVLAVSVIISHAWPLALGPGTAEPLDRSTGHSLGGWAIGGFFFISGLLITASAQRSTPHRFWVARARRILPGLGAAMLVTLALAYVSGSSANVQEAMTWYIRALTLVSIEHRLTGAFAANPYSEIVNGPLWSLFHEVLAYAICAVFVWAGGARNTISICALLGVATFACLMADALPARGTTFAPLFAAFGLGMAAYVWRDRITLHPLLVFAALAATIVLPAELSLGFAGFAMVVLVLSGPIATLGHDASYGMYIYGWPIAQTIVAAMPGIMPVPLAILSVLATYPIALISWHFVERPGLARRRAVA